MICPILYKFTECIAIAWKKTVKRYLLV
jgi:hypothetical protein